MTELAGDLSLAPILPALSERRPFWRGLRLFAVTIVLTLVFIFVTLVAIVLFDAKALRGGGQTLTYQIATFATYVPIALFLLWRLPRLTGETLAQIGLRLPRRNDLVALAVTTVILFVARFAYALTMQQLHIKHTQAGFEDFHVRGLAAIVFVLITISVVAPITEELLFRGVLFRTLTWRMPVFIAAAISSLIFALAHGDAIVFILIAFMGFLQAMLYARTGNLVVSMMLHGINNLIATSFLIALPK